MQGRTLAIKEVNAGQGRYLLIGSGLLQDSTAAHDTGLKADRHMWVEMSGRLHMQKDYLIERQILLAWPQNY